MLAENFFQLRRKLIERGLRFRLVFPETFQVNLNFSQGGQDRGDRIFVPGIEGRDPLLGSRLGQPRQTKFTGPYDRGRNTLSQPGQAAMLEQGAKLPGRAGEQDDNFPLLFDPQSRRSAVAIGKDGGSLDDHGLTEVDFRHPQTASAKSGFHRSHQRLVSSQRPPQSGCDAFPCQVIACRAQTADCQDNFRALQRQRDRGGQASFFIPHHGLENDIDTDPVQLLGKEKGVRVGPERGEQFRADSNNLCIHYDRKGAQDRMGFQKKRKGREPASRF